jgi:hypothetical protein
MTSDSKIEVNLEPIQLIGRVYYGGSYENRDKFDGVFTVILLGEGRAKLMAAHGKSTVLACKEIFRQLRENYGVSTCEVERKGMTRIWDLNKF